MSLYTSNGIHIYPSMKTKPRGISSHHHLTCLFNVLLDHRWGLNQLVHRWGLQLHVMIHQAILSSCMLLICCTTISNHPFLNVLPVHKWGHRLTSIMCATAILPPKLMTSFVRPNAPKLLMMNMWLRMSTRLYKHNMILFPSRWKLFKELLLKWLFFLFVDILIVDTLMNQPIDYTISAKKSWKQMLKSVGPHFSYRVQPLQCSIIFLLRGLDTSMSIQWMVSSTLQQTHTWNTCVSRRHQIQVIMYFYFIAYINLLWWFSLWLVSICSAEICSSYSCGLSTSAQQWPTTQQWSANCPLSASRDLIISAGTVLCIF